jgi:hypothetical protein
LFWVINQIIWPIDKKKQEKLKIVRIINKILTPIKVISYQFESEGIMRVTFAGNIVYQDISNWLNEFSVITGLPQQINLLYDLRKANLLIDAVKLIHITKKTEEATRKFERVHTVFLIEENALPTYSMLLSFLDVNGNTKRKLFTNNEKALLWLKNESALHA